MTEKLESAVMLAARAVCFSHAGKTVGEIAPLIEADRRAVRRAVLAELRERLTAIADDNCTQFVHLHTVQDVIAELEQADE